MTITGADERTPIRDLVALADAGVEVGLLYTHRPDGRKRYPPLPWLVDAALALQGRAAIHVCGARAKEELHDNGRITNTLSLARRIQINGHFNGITAFCDSWPSKTIITQSPYTTYATAGNHAVLVDGSGGTGKLPDRWQLPVFDCRVGFAGGLTPDNLATQLPLIASVAVGPWWIDMESGVRDADDWFSVDLAWQAVEQFKSWVKRGAS